MTKKARLSFMRIKSYDKFFRYARILNSLELECLTWHIGRILGKDNGIALDGDISAIMLLGATVEQLERAHYNFIYGEDTGDVAWRVDNKQ